MIKTKRQELFTKNINTLLFNIMASKTDSLNGLLKSLILFLFLAACIIPAFAEHTTSVTVTPTFVRGGV